GAIAQHIVAFSQRHGGLLELDDLATFSTKVETPASVLYRGYEVCKCGPWSQGPVFLQQLRLLEGYDLHALGHNSTAYIHTVIEAWRACSPVVEGLVFPLTTRNQVFYLDPQHPNSLAPRKRPRTTLTPSLVRRDGQPFMAFGTMGLDQQDQWTLQFFLNVVDFGMSLQEAIEAPKFSSRHFQSSVYPHTAEPGLLR